MKKDFQHLPVEVRNWVGRQLFENVPNNIVVIDRDFKVLTANENFKQVFGEPQGKYCYEVYKNEKKVCDNCMAARTFEDGKVRTNDEVGFDRNGRPAHYVVHIAPVFDEIGKIVYVIEMSYDVTQNKSLQREYNILFERVPCFVSVINRDLKIVKANELLRSTFGESLGEHCYEVYKNRSEQCPDCPAIKTFADGKTYSAEQVGISKTGDLTHYIVSTTPLSRSGREFSHVIEMSADVTDAHRLSEELVRESYFRGVLIDNILDALVAVDVSGTVNIFNQAAESLFNVEAKDVIGKSKGRRFLPQEFQEAIKNRGSTVALAESSVTNTAGEIIPVRVAGSVLWDKDQVIGGAVFLQDLREIKKLEKEKLENERLAAVGQTVAQLAHGIKNILTGLQGGLYVIKSGMRSGSQEKTDKGWNMLERNVGRITELVKGFLSFSKGYVPKARLVDPNEVAEEVYSLFKNAAKEQGIQLSYEPKPDVAHVCGRNRRNPRI
ncbi:MAG: PAS domain-containing protein [Deltaproteobacteria bacterium]|nr:PAS domain-containing protein [Deltaproteobacteria bacterium]